MKVEFSAYTNEGGSGLVRLNQKGAILICNTSLLAAKKIKVVDQKIPV